MSYPAAAGHGSPFNPAPLSLSDECRNRLEALLRSLEGDTALDMLRDQIVDAARCAARDVRRASSCAEHLVIALKHHWRTISGASKLPRETLHQAIERLVSTAIVEFYRAE